MANEPKSAFNLAAWKKAAWRRLLLISGGWRAWFNHCPACNDDAPELDSCKVCENWAGWNRPNWPAPAKLRRKWWQRFKYRVESGSFD